MKNNLTVTRGPFPNRPRENATRSWFISQYYFTLPTIIQCKYWIE